MLLSAITSWLCTNSLNPPTGPFVRTPEVWIFSGRRLARSSQASGVTSSLAESACSSPAWSRMRPAPRLGKYRLRKSRSAQPSLYSTVNWYFGWSSSTTNPHLQCRSCASTNRGCAARCRSFVQIRPVDLGHQGFEHRRFRAALPHLDARAILLGHGKQPLPNLFGYGVAL